MNIMRHAVFTLLLIAGVTAGAAQWRMLADGSRLEFFIDYSGQEAPGLFRQFTTELQFDSASPADGRLVVTVVTLSADLDSADINEAIAGPDWFDFAHYADAQFVSESIASLDEGRFVATGRLRLKGIERVIDVPFTWTEADGLAFMRGELTLRRGAFAIGSGEWAATDVIGENVRVRFDVALQSVAGQSEVD